MGMHRQIIVDAVGAIFGIYRFQCLGGDGEIQQTLRYQAVGCTSRGPFEGSDDRRLGCFLPDLRR